MPTQHVEPVELPIHARRAIAELAAELGATSKQTAFAELVVARLPFAEAYRRVYDVADPTSPSTYRQATAAAQNGTISALVTEGRATLNNLRGLDGAAWRAKINDRLHSIVDDSDAKTADVLQALKLAGTQVHVQAFAAASADPDAKLATDFAELVSAFNSELYESGIKCIDASYTVVQSEQITQPVDNTWIIRLRRPIEQDECACMSGGCD